MLPLAAEMQKVLQVAYCIVKLMSNSFFFFFFFLVECLKQVFHKLL